MKDLKERAKKALEKKSIYGRDINFDDYQQEGSTHEYISDLNSIAEAEKAQMLKAGIDTNQKERSGTFLQFDHSVIHCNIRQDGVEIMSTVDAIEKYPWLEQYWWKAVQVDTDKYTARAELHQEHGYFIRSLKGVKTIFPVQACLYMSRDNLIQDLHNIIIAEENSELHIITGCATASHVKKGLHVGISEFYIKKGAKLSFTMIHSWAEELVTRPRSVAIVEQGGVFLSNYICLKPAKDIQMYPTAILEGENSIAQFNSIIVAYPNSEMDIGSRVILRAKGARAEIISRALSSGGTIIARGHLRGEVEDIKAHLECRGLILSERGRIHAIPELEGLVSQVDMSHEAAVGKIDQEQIKYLRARGLSESEATSLIVRGFLNVDIVGLPEDLRKHLQKVMEESEKDLF